MGHGNPGKSWNLFWHFPGLESPGKLIQVLESPGNLLTLVIKFSLKTIFCRIIFGFLFCEGLLLQLPCTWEPWKNAFESWKIVSEKGYEP